MTKQEREKLRRLIDEHARERARRQPIEEPLLELPHRWGRPHQFRGLCFLCGQPAEEVLCAAHSWAAR